MAKIVLSYRRADSLEMAGRIRERLARHYGASAVFRDLDDIAIGQTFPDVIREAVAGSDAFLALIGRHWAVDGAGTARLLEAGDWVRFELETALACDVPIVPVLIGDAKMPPAGQLPPKLAPLCLVNAARVDPGGDFDYHMRRLIAAIEKPQSFVPALLLIDGADTLLGALASVFTHAGLDLAGLLWPALAMIELVTAVAILRRVPSMRWIGAAVCAVAAGLSADLLLGAARWFEDLAGAAWTVHQATFAALFALACACCVMGWQRNFGEDRSLGMSAARRLSMLAFALFAVLAGAVSLFDAAMATTPAGIVRLAAFAAAVTAVLGYFGLALVRRSPSI